MSTDTPPCQSREHSSSLVVETTGQQKKILDPERATQKRLGNVKRTESIYIDSEIDDYPEELKSLFMTHTLSSEGTDRRSSWLSDPGPAGPPGLSLEIPEIPKDTSKPRDTLNLKQHEEIADLRLKNEWLQKELHSLKAAWRSMSRTESLVIDKEIEDYPEDLKPLFKTHELSPRGLNQRSSWLEGSKIEASSTHADASDKVSGMVANGNDVKRGAIGLLRANLYLFSLLWSLLIPVAFAPKISLNYVGLLDPSAMEVLLVKVIIGFCIVFAAGCFTAAFKGDKKIMEALTWIQFGICLINGCSFHPFVLWGSEYPFVGTPAYFIFWSTLVAGAVRNLYIAVSFSDRKSKRC